MFSYVLIGVGLVLVAASFFVSEKIDEKLGKNEAQALQQTVDVWNEKDEKNVREHIETILSEKTEDAIVKVDDQLSQISNEKIMAVSEFSDQLLEKLEQNHSEVVFLYNMLGEKEEEIKQLVNKPIQVAAVETVVEEKEDSVEVSAKEKVFEKKTTGNITQATGLEVAAAKSAEAEEGNQNERILKLHDKGKSVLEISRELGLGQGEVKLVIDLFQGVS